MSKRAVLMMTFGSPEEITYEGCTDPKKLDKLFKQRI